jgi:ribonuclease D
MTIEVHEGDLPAGLSFGDTVAVDSETLGLDLRRDRLCVVQLSAGDGTCHLVHFPDARYEAPNLRALMADSSVTKLFHYARFDVAVIRHRLNILCSPIYCTKIASKLVRTYTDRHGLKDLCRELLGVDLNKQQQSSDWGARTLTKEQVEYAASDVLHLHELRRRLDAMLERDGRMHFAQACFAFLPIRAELDLAGWPDQDIFAH